MIDDFKISSYREILRLAKNNYRFISYNEIEFDQPFILWRHDCDISVNRSLKLAQVEREEGIKSTFFLLPHSEFYNLLEKAQFDIVNKIIDLGHNIGLHFDAQFFNIQSERELDDLVIKESSLIKDWFGITPNVFSFHNPNKFLLTCEKEVYGGLINCYSSIFKSKIAYCSDSNGYWRYKRLHDVISGGEEKYLQILTHPEWWQERPLAPRERVVRSIYGRAVANKNKYDEALMQGGRQNVAGLSSKFLFIKEDQPARFEILDFMNINEIYDSLFCELWRLLADQIKTLFYDYLKITGATIPDLFNEDFLSSAKIDNFITCFEQTFGNNFFSLFNCDRGKFIRFNRLKYGLNSKDINSMSTKLIEGCTFICELSYNILLWKKTL